MIPLFDLARVLRPHSEEIYSAFQQCFESAKFINGPQVKHFEAQLAEYTGTKHGIGVSSGTDALLAIFMALEMDAGTEVIVTPFTFVASASTIVRAGYTPVFADLAPGSFHPSVEQIDAARTENTRAVLVVHLFGEPNDLTEIKEYCDVNNLLMIEDCAQSLGSMWEDKKIGSYGEAAAYSFFPAKNLGCFGDGGGITTNNSILADKILTITSHGCKVKYNSEIIGGNFRLDTVQAAMLSILLPKLDGWIDIRNNNARRYLTEFSGIEEIKLPRDKKGHSWNQFTLITKHRDALKKHLDEANIGSAIYYPHALHKQPAFERLHAQRSSGRLIEAERRCKEVISLPVYPGLLEEEQSLVIKTVKEFFGE